MIPKRLWALGVVVLGAMLFLSIGCEVTIDIDDGGDGDVGPTETRDDSFSVGEAPVVVVTSEFSLVPLDCPSCGAGIKADGQDVVAARMQGMAL